MCYNQTCCPYIIVIGLDKKSYVYNDKDLTLYYLGYNRQNHAYWSTFTFRMPSILRPTYYIIVTFLCIAVVISFIVFAPFTYGFPSLTIEQIKWRHWVETWDLLHHVL